MPDIDIPAARALCAAIPSWELRPKVLALCDEVERLQGIVANLTAELRRGDERQQLIARQAAEAAKGKSNG